MLHCPKALLAGAACFLTSPAWCQGEPPAVYTNTVRTTPQSFTNVTDAEALRLTGYGLPDVVFLDAGNVLLWVAPGVHETRLQLPGQDDFGGVTAMCSFYNYPVLGLDTLVLAGEQGIGTWRYSEGAPVTHIFSELGSALDIVPAQLEGYTIGLFVLESDGKTLSLFGQQDEEWIQLNTEELSLPPHDIDCADWDLDGESELVICDAAGFRVREALSPTTHISIDWASSNGHLATMVVSPTEPIKNKALIAWSSGLDESQDAILALGPESDQPGMPYMSTVQLGGRQCGGILGTDIEGDGHPDFLPVSLTTPEVIAFFDVTNYSENPGFFYEAGAAVIVPFSLESSSIVNSCGPLVADFDGGTVNDLILPLSDLDLIGMVMGTDWAGVGTLEDSVGQLISSGGLMEQIGNTTDYNFNIQLDTTAFGNAATQWANAVDVCMWEITWNVNDQPEMVPNSGQRDTHYYGVSRNHPSYPLSNPPSAIDNIDDILVSAPWLDGNATGYTNSYGFLIRPLVVNDAGETLRAYKGAQGIMTSDCAQRQIAWNYATNNGNNPVTTAIIGLGDPCGPGEDGGGVLIEVVYRPCLPSTAWPALPSLPPLPVPNWN